MKKIFLLCVALCACTADMNAQHDSLKKKNRKLSFYLGWGYNRDYYTTSSIRFVNTESNELNGTYDFVVHDVKAHDQPDFDKLGDIANISIPQYNYRLGFWLNNKNDEGFEVNFDHAKYVVTDGQTARFTGTIQGQAIDKDSVLNKQYFHFEHTDGANFLQLYYMKRNRIYYNKKQMFKLSYIFKPGCGIVVPRTDATLFGHRVNNSWKIAGFTASIEVSLRAEIRKHMYIELAGKSGWADYINCFVSGRGNGKASHRFGYVEGILVAGYQF